MPSSASELSQRKKAQHYDNSPTTTTATTNTGTHATASSIHQGATTSSRKANGSLFNEASTTATAFTSTLQTNLESQLREKPNLSSSTSGYHQSDGPSNSKATSNGNGISNNIGNGIVKGALSNSRSTTDDEHDSDTSSDRFDTMDEITRWRISVAPYCPSYSVAFKAIFLVRTLAATYANISDCDEVFNFWEPMHYLQYGTGLETWEYSPLYAIRSWAYILVHALPAEITRLATSANRIPIILIDHYYYNNLVIVPLNIVLYNVFGGDVGPDIFGTEPWWFYILNGLLNFNVLFLAALLSFPVLVFTFLVAPDVLPNPPSSSGQLKDPLVLFTLKLSPFYLWFAIFTAQPHKEERFLFVVYPLICFNAVMTLFMAQKVIQRGLDRFVTRSKTAAIHKYSRGLVWVVLVASAAISMSRILALYEHYSAPIDVYRNAFDLVKVPEPIVIGVTTAAVEGSSTEPIVVASHSPSTTESGSEGTVGKKEIIRVCVGKEWYRFPSHYFLPEGARLGLIKSYFDGLLPGEFHEYSDASDLKKSQHPLAIDWRWSADRRPGTSFIPTLMNNENKEVVEHYTPLEQCQYLVDLDYSGRPEPSEASSESLTGDEINNDSNNSDTVDLEPRYLQNKDQWEKLYCRKYLDTTVGAGRNRWVRAFWIPDKITLALTRGQPKAWGDYCLARRKIHSGQRNPSIDG
ncbi:mannosyltransferase [Podila humilis]|nr:mannosyltransferase [Podila humilis]